MQTARHRRSSRIALGLVAIGGTAGLTLAQTINPVEPIVGGSFVKVYDVNATGTAAAGYTDNALSVDTALRWTNPGGSVSMGLLPGGTFNSYATGIDGSGTILCGYGDSGSSRAYRWTNTGGYQILPLFSASWGASPNNYSVANGISQSGADVVGTVGLGTGSRAFIWSSSAPSFLQIVGPVSPYSDTTGLAISGDGTTITGASGIYTFRQKNGASGPLPFVPIATSMRGEAINTDGSVIGGRYTTSSGSEFGYVWRLSAPTISTSLPQTPNGCIALRPKAMNGDGLLIGGETVDNVAGFAGFVWTPPMATQLAANHLQNRGVNLTGWQIRDVTGISPDGKAMCGNGIYNGVPNGWVVKQLNCPTIFGLITAIGGNGCIGSTFTLVEPSWSLPGGGGFIRWFKNGVLLNSGLQPSGSTIVDANSGLLVINNFQPGDAGSYVFAISSQGACEVVSSAFAVAGPSVLGQNIQPGSATVCAGQNPSLFAVPSAPTVAPSSVTYRWQRLVAGPAIYADLSDGPTGNGSTLVGTGTSTFSIISAQPADAGIYRCVFGILGCSAASQISSNSASLTITASAPAVTGPGNITTCPADNDEFFSVTAPAGSTYQWQAASPPGSNTFVNIANGPVGAASSYGGVTTATLGIFTQGLGLSDKYRCVVTGPCGGVTTSQVGIYTLIVVPTLTGPAALEQCLGDYDAEFTVGATPNIGVTYQWQRLVPPFPNVYANIANGPTGFGGTYNGVTSSTLTINGINPGDASRYRCVVTEPCYGQSTTSVSAPLTVITVPSVQTQPVGGPVCFGGTKSMSVALAPASLGTVNYQWLRKVGAATMFSAVVDGTLPGGAVASGAQLPTLGLSGFTGSDAGQYRCDVTTSCGFAFSNAVTLTLCRADFNCSGAVEVGDIFAFLSAWFASDPKSDVDGDTMKTVADIFAFLSLWFAGC
ncbi:MAG: hypothetical protein K2Q20_05730 [Phycisphaerales bacterium]|nr:hypothetical protein [Phycisphaerales bacterium]